MFESAILSVLTADATLTGYLSTHEGSPAIFSNTAPEGADWTYLVFTIADDGNEDDSVIDLFTVTFDVYGYGKSGKNERLAVRRIIELLDREHLSHSYYDNIRFFKGPIDFIETGDPLSQHYNLRFNARAGRSGWMSSL